MFQYIKRIFQALVFGPSVRNGVFPTSADGAAAVAITLAAAAVAWTWGAWVQIVAAAGVTTPQRILGFTLENLVGAAAQGEVAIGIGAGGAEVEIGRYPIVGAVYTLPVALSVPNATRIAARYRTSTGVADTVDVKLLVATGI